MTDAVQVLRSENSEPSLYEILRNCVSLQSAESLPTEDYNDVCASSIGDYYKMISANSCSTRGTISCGIFASDDPFAEGILEENGRISLAYENLRTIPRRIAEKFAAQTKFLDLSYNNFQNIAFLSFFEDLHTLILDRNTRLNVNTLPYLPNLKILWLNNCDINIHLWIHRIKIQCPALEQLSIMGNRAVMNPCGVLPPNSTTGQAPICIGIDHREFVLEQLPQLNYLDGIARNSKPTSNGSHTLNGKNASNQKLHSGNTHSQRKTSSIISFKDLFRLKSKTKSYYGSSTN